MRVAGDLGFSSLVLVFCLIFPVIGLVIRRKWRLASAKQEDIERLLILASKEARRAEEEAFASFGLAPPSSTNYQCAVCFSPTTRRCARCKAVRYCSGKCQIVHWRQGHKEECRPPINNEENDGDQKVNSDQQELYGERFEMEYRECSNPIENGHGESTFSGSSYSPEALRSKDEDIKVDAVGIATDLTFESSSTSFSGFSATSSSNESSDDLSVSESVGLNENEGSIGYLSADDGQEMLGMTSNEIKVDQTGLLSSNFTNLVDSVDSFNTLGKLNNNKPSSSNRGSQHASSKLSVLSQNPMSENSNAKPCEISAGFWGRALDLNGSPSQVCTDTAVSNSDIADRGVLSDSESLARFSFHFSGDDLHLQTKYSVEKDVGTGDGLPASQAINKSADTAATLENAGVDNLNVMNSSSSNCGRSKDVVNDFSHESFVPKSREVESVLLSSHKYRSSSALEDSFTKDTSKVSRLQSVGSARTNHVNDTAIASHLPKSGEVERLTSVSQANLASTCDGHSLPSVKYGNVNGVQTVASSQVSSFPNPKIGLKSSMLKVVDQLRGSKLSKHHSSGIGGEGAEKYSDKGLFPYELFVKLYTWNKMELRPCGLVNCGNSCYANAVLQCLAFTPPLTAYFLQGLHSNACGKKGWCFTCEFESIILKAKEGKSPLSPMGILSKLQNIGRQLGNGREEDAHEFLRYAIDAMQSVCLLEAGVSASGSPEEETTLIGLTFGGYLRSKIKCARCQGKSERRERMMDLTVEIEGDIQTLEEALLRFTATELLDGDNKYQCSRCKSYEKAKKKLTILEAPNVLTIALKRFQSGKFGKLNKAIRFPEMLDLAPYMSGTSDKSTAYRLFGVVVHLDVMNASFSGHYVCYIKTVQNKWFKIDDSTVTTVELERVLTKGAYMLLYARCSPRAPKLIRNRMIPSDAKIKTIPSMVNGKNASAKSTPNYESFYTKFHHIQRILEDDSSSDSYSFTSSNSDEASCSTDSNRDSTSTDDFSDFIFGDSGRVWRNKIYSDSDTSSSSSSSPSYLRHPQLANPEYCAPAPPETSASQAYRADSAIMHDGWDRRLPNGNGRPVNFEGKASNVFLHSDSTKQCRKSASNGISSFRETEERLGRNTPFNDVKSGVCRERTS